LPTASLVVTTYNWKEALALCLHSIARQRTRPLDVVVADDGSREDTARMVEELARDFPVPLRHAWQEDERPAAGRDRGHACDALRAWVRWASAGLRWWLVAVGRWRRSGPFDFGPAGLRSGRTGWGGSVRLAFLADRCVWPFWSVRLAFHRSS
jgi:glycosyltransferase involved in cell wall biosynthesis